MSTDHEHSLPLGARLFPGVDLTLWIALMVSALLLTVVVVGGFALALH